MIKNYEGQINLFETLEAGCVRDSQSLRTCPEYSLAITEKTSEKSSKNPLESLSRKRPVFLYLKADGPRKEWSAEIPGALHGQYTMPSSTAFHKEEKDYLWSATMGAWQPIRCCLSAILQPDADLSKYALSPKACQGILNRAERRGKELPEILKAALLRQAALDGGNRG